MTVIWRLHDLSLRGRRGDRLSVTRLEIAAGVTAVLGQSGAGKSSLLGLLAGLECRSAGRFEFDDRALGNDSGSGSRPARFWSPQEQGLWSHLSVQEHIEVVQTIDDQRSAVDWLTLFDLESLARSLPGELSTGERSRLSVLRALASQARCLILDEPLAHVDEARVDRYWQIIEQQVALTQATCVFSTHDSVCIRRFANGCVCLEQGRVAFSGDVDRLYFDPPSESTAWMLGPANLAGKTGFERLLKQDGLPNCIRPEELRFVPDPNGHKVRSTRRIAGAYAVDFEGEAGLTTIFLAEEPSGVGRLVFEPARSRPC